MENLLLLGVSIFKHITVDLTYILCPIDFMMGFNDFIVFLSLYMGQGHNAWHILTYRQDHFTITIHEWIDLYFCFTDLDTHH